MMSNENKSLITAATEIILKCSNDTLEGIAQRALVELQSRGNKEALEANSSLCGKLLGEIEHNLK
ncbi:hypothetical protein L1267_17850 [Pseudoalteromonas sp. OFAV1]|uniref:hypothetical protein n=1 Tax=Pseudoalteromonas sp. OFAV1 TaxID=2908892 RepID=UPI001F2749BC|nr:hypothetical protein [Pseudoalteromonas sp. OFAV1]MCF2902236.1 hypothetical protein [Pseudoalteromonas sp. OFAV1]